MQRHVVSLALGLTLVCTPWAAAQPASPSAAVPEMLLQQMQQPTPIVADLEHLTDVIGGRPTGSSALNRAVTWALEKFRAAGVDSVTNEEYTVPLLWLPGVELGVITQPPLADGGASPLPIRVVARPYSAPTPEAGLTAEVIDVGAGDEAGFATAGEKVKGRWVLVHSEPMDSMEKLFQEYLDTPGLVSRAKTAGAAGILTMSTRPQGLLYRHNLTLDGTLAPLPAVMLVREDAERVARLLANGETVKVRIISRPRVVANATARNVVAEIRGEGLAEEKVILGAHLDSWDLGTGAEDNGCNVALVIDAARQMAALARTGFRPRRTLRFVLYTGEELGLVGSMADVRENRAELDRFVAQMTVDEGSGAITGFSLGGRDDLRAAVEAALASAASLGPFENTTDAFIGTDNYDYLIEGIPTLVANQEHAPYLPDYHASSDTFDKVDQRSLKRNAAITASVMWALANADSAPAPRLSRPQVDALVHATELDQQMRIFGLWDDYASGRRGRQP